MRRVWRAFPLVLLVMAFTTVTKAIPNRMDGQEVPVQAAEVRTVTGELTNVDAENKTFRIKPENEEEMLFQYDENTKVEGRENGIQGLATETGIQVTVSYSEEDGKRIATRVEIKKSDG